MTHDRNFFTPDDVDMQVDQLSQHSIREHLPPNKRAEEPYPAEASLVRELKAYYRPEQQENNTSLERAWERVSVRLPRDHVLTQLTMKPLSTPTGLFQERLLIMQNHISRVTRRGNFSRVLGLLAAGLVAALVVGSLVAVLNLSRHQGTTTGGSAVQATHVPTATSVPALIPGKTLYTTPAEQWGFENLSWSPDSKRIASLMRSTQGIQFWDATTGKHMVTVQLPGGTSEWAYALAWSPTSEVVAVATNQHILVVNGQTGNIISSSMADTRKASNITSSGQTRLSNRFAASGGLGYRTIAWSPDGHLLAVGLSLGINGEVQVWNPQTGATDFSLQVGTTDNVGALAWSSDGQYIAANIWNTQATGPSQASGKVVAWNVSTHQMVFQQSDFLDSSDAPVIWQPRTHNLAFFSVPSSGSNQVATFEIWDATTGQPVKQLVGVGGAVTWSPDGTDLAYADLKSVIIMDVASGKQIFVYKEHHQPVVVIAWSPDGKDIISGESSSPAMNNLQKQTLAVAKVWTA